MHETDKTIRDIGNSVLEKIRDGSTKKRPRSYFVARAALLVVGSVAVAFALLFVVSFIFFLLRQNGTWFAPSFGAHGVFILLGTLPWLLIIVALVFVVMLEIMVQRYAIAYRRPLVYSALAVMFIALVGGFVVSETPLHGSLYRQARADRLPVAGPLYETFGMRPSKAVHAGMVIGIDGGGLTIETPANDTLKVLVDAGTRFPFGTDLQLDDLIVVIGERDDQVVRAYGIRRLEEIIEPFPMHWREHGTTVPMFMRSPHR